MEGRSTCLNFLPRKFRHIKLHPGTCLQVHPLLEQINTDRNSLVQGWSCPALSLCSNQRELQAPAAAAQRTAPSWQRMVFHGAYGQCTMDAPCSHPGSDCQSTTSMRHLWTTASSTLCNSFLERVVHSVT